VEYNFELVSSQRFVKVVLCFTVDMGQDVCTFALLELRCWWRSDTACFVATEEWRTWRFCTKGVL